MIKKLFKKLIQSEEASLLAPSGPAAADSVPSQLAAEQSHEDSKTFTKDNNNMSNIQHQYLEVSADLLAKPSALCDLVESQGGKATLIYCNNPSDADFVEVILKKRGINALKLIGFVAQEKLTATQEKVKNAEIAALVVTDVAARGADLSLFSSIINYSLPIDLDNYSNRIGSDQAGDRTIYSIISPSDIANLHSLKTQTNFNLVQAEATSKEQLANAKLLKIKNTAVAKFSTLNANLVELAKQIVADKDAEQIVSFLVQQSIEIIPQLQSQVEKLTWEKENQEQDEDFSHGQGSRKPYRADNWGSDNNRDRGDDNRGPRGQNNRRDRDSYRGQDNRSRSRSDEYSDQSDSDSQSYDSADNSQRGRRRRDDWKPAPTKIRDDRLYIGKGQKDGFGKEDFLALLKEKCDLEQDQLKRFLVRKNYCFADLAENIAADVVAKLDGAESKAGNVYVAKATQVVTVIENQADEQQEGSADDSQEIADEQQATV